ncbi:MAG TPA: SUMF1/EgtB/PvdO family nonheme iron enzyme [Polyangiaceae bacterium]|nr:SUMF1/EgtB/PvdO family nonheme iron enzyme [Polyangiaceae bacterium]
MSDHQKFADFYIDSTEVTVAQYRKFIAAVRNTPPKQTQYCSWNNSLIHNDSSALLEDPQMPIGGVDRCDATSYCEWADKHLCGNIDRRAKRVEKQFFDPPVNQWFLACGGPTGAMHPSISGCSPGINTVASSACEGSYPGVFDLEGKSFALGRAAEQQSICLSVTGGYARGSSSFRWIGFRCCSG